MVSELKCRNCGAAEIEVIEDISTHYTFEEEDTYIIVTSSGCCRVCEEHHIWEEKYQLIGYQNIERVED